MAEPTTTIQGKVIIPNGRGATSGEIVFDLDRPGKVMDGGTAHRIGGRWRVPIKSDGSFDLALVPNDQIIRDGQVDPGGSIYKCTIRVATPYRSEWPEYLNLGSSPDPVDFGAIQRARPQLPEWTGVSDDYFDALPTPDEDWYKLIVVIEGGTGVGDLTYICLKNSSDAYYWHSLTQATIFT